jgi:hypothetical protein
LWIIITTLAYVTKIVPQKNKKKTAPDPIDKTSTGIDTHGYLLLTSGEEGRKQGRKEGGKGGGVCEYQN